MHCLLARVSTNDDDFSVHSSTKLQILRILDRLDPARLFGLPDLDHGMESGLVDPFEFDHCVLGFESIDSHVEFSIVYRDADLIVHHICEQDTFQHDATKQFISKGHC